MNSRTLTLLVIVALAAGATGWFLHTPPAAPEKTAETPAPASVPMSAAPKAASPTQVAAPTVAPAPKSAPAVAATSAPAPVSVPTTTGSAAGSSPQPAPPELASAITEMGAAVHAGDLVSLMETYTPPAQLANLTPEQKTFMENQLQQQAQSPQAQQNLQAMAKMFDALGGLTPNISADGTHATYQVPTNGIAPAGTNLPSTVPISFVKVGDRWYINNGGM